MNFRPHLSSGLVFFAPMFGALAATPPAPPPSTPPGPVQPAANTKPAPMTSAPGQPNTHSAPGAASPIGSNGTTLGGTSVTAAPSTTGAGAPPPGAAPASSQVLDNYMKDLTDALKLTAEEKNDIQTYYLADGTVLRDTLNDESLSPLKQAEKVAELRDTRDEKIEALLQEVDRQREFFEVEDRYRVALTEAAMEGGLLPAGALPAVPTPTGTLPGAAEPTPTVNNGTPDLNSPKTLKK